MVFKKITQITLIITLLFSASSQPLMANDTAVQQVTSKVPASLEYIPGGTWLYTETLGNRPGTCMLAILGLIATKMIHEKYKEYHNTRAKIRRQLWEKIQHECYTFSSKGLSDAAKVRDFSDPNITNALLKKKNDWLRDARGISNWGVLQDDRLITLLDEFFTVLKSKSANQQGLPAPAAQKTWWQFWRANHGQRLLPDILTEIEECLMGSCG